MRYIFFGVIKFRCYAIDFTFTSPKELYFIFGRRCVLAGSPHVVVNGSLLPEFKGKIFFRMKQWNIMTQSPGIELKITENENIDINKIV